MPTRSVAPSCKLRPIYETLVDIIHEATAEELDHSVSSLIMMTKITSNYQAIRDALAARVQSHDLLPADFQILSDSLDKQERGQVQDVANREEIREKLISILAEESGVTADKILDPSRLGDDLGIGNTIGRAEFLDLKTRLEKEFAIIIPHQDIPPAEEMAKATVAEIISLLQRLLTEKLFASITSP